MSIQTVNTGSVITYRVDYCNSLLYGAPENLTEHVQSLLNVVARRNISMIMGTLTMWVTLWGRGSLAACPAADRLQVCYSCPQDKRLAPHYLTKTSVQSSTMIFVLQCRTDLLFWGRRSSLVTNRLLLQDWQSRTH